MPLTLKSEADWVSCKGCRRKLVSNLSKCSVQSVWECATRGGKAKWWKQRRTRTKTKEGAPRAICEWSTPRRTSFTTFLLLVHCKAHTHSQSVRHHYRYGNFVNRLTGKVYNNYYYSLTTLSEHSKVWIFYCLPFLLLPLPLWPLI